MGVFRPRRRYFVEARKDLFGARQERAMTRVPDTDLFYLTTRLEPDARTNYLFLEDYKKRVKAPKKNAEKPQPVIITSIQVEYIYKGRAKMKEFRLR